MGTQILKSFGALQSELEQARSSLRGVDESIKRLIGRDPSDMPPRPPLKRPAPGGDDRGGGGGGGRLNRATVRSRAFVPADEDQPLAGPKRRTGVSVFKRLSERPQHYKDDPPTKQMISKVIVTPKEVPSRQEALAAQSKDEKSKARNRRMFGALLGTLQKFQQEETKLKQREEKRAQLEKKIEEHEIKEKEEIKKERQNLFLSRKKKQAEIKMIELKMLRMREFAMWEERQKPRINFIKTKTKPHIHYLPRRMNEATKTLLQSCKEEIQKMIDTKKQEVCDELQRIEDRMRRNFEEKVLRKDDKQEDHEEDEDEDDHDHYHDRPNRQELGDKKEQTQAATENKTCEENKDISEDQEEGKNVSEEKSDLPIPQEVEERSEEKMEIEQHSQDVEQSANIEHSGTDTHSMNVSEYGKTLQMTWGDIPFTTELNSAENVNTNVDLAANGITSQFENSEQVENSDNV